MGAEVVSLEQRAEQLVRSGRAVGLAGPDPVSRDGSVTINVPTAVGGPALLVHKRRDPEVDENLNLRCTKCRARNADIVVVVGFPQGDGDPIQVCRTCVDRPVGHPLVIQFRA